MCVCVCVCESVCVRARARSLIYPACKEYAPYYVVICGFSGFATFSALSHKRHDFRKKLWNIKWVFWYSLRLYMKRFSLEKKFSKILSIMWKFLHVKYPLFLSDFNKIWLFSTEFQKESLNIKLQWELSCSRWAGGRTEGRTNERANG